MPRRKLQLHIRQHRPRDRALYEIIGFDRFAVYVFDYGAPTGFRLAVATRADHGHHLENGNAYEEGLSEGWSPIKAYWQDLRKRTERRFALPRAETTRCSTPRCSRQTIVSPDGQNLDNFYLARPGADEVQLDLFGDYKSNVALYPSFQQYFRNR